MFFSTVAKTGVVVRQRDSALQVADVVTFVAQDA